MLETIREYALEQLAEAGDTDRLRRAHAEAFLALAESADMSAESDYGLRYDVLPPEQENLRAAIDWLRSGRADRARGSARDLTRELLGDRRPVRGGAQVRRAARKEVGSPTSFAPGHFAAMRALRSSRASTSRHSARTRRAWRCSGRPEMRRGLPSFCIRIGINTLTLGDARGRESCWSRAWPCIEGSVRPGARRRRSVLSGMSRTTRGTSSGGSSCSVGASRCARRSGSPGGKRAPWPTRRIASSSSGGSRSRRRTYRRALALSRRDRRPAVGRVHAGVHGAKRGRGWRRRPGGQALGRGRGRGGACSAGPVGDRARGIEKRVLVADGAVFERSRAKGHCSPYEAAVDEAPRAPTARRR